MIFIYIILYDIIFLLYQYASTYRIDPIYQLNKNNNMKEYGLQYSNSQKIKWQGKYFLALQIGKIERFEWKNILSTS